MRPAQSAPENSAEVLMEKAADCFDLARTQHEIADKQQASADRLDLLAHALETDAVALKGKMRIDAGRGRASSEDDVKDCPPDDPRRSRERA